MTKCLPIKSKNVAGKVSLVLPRCSSSGPSPWPSRDLTWEDDLCWASLHHWLPPVSHKCVDFPRLKRVALITSLVKMISEKKIVSILDWK